jgi:hypothetical protein
LHRDAALTLVAGNPMPPSSELSLHKVLDRLGPSVFTGLGNLQKFARQPLSQICKPLIHLPF